MIIEKFSLKNYRCYKDQTIETTKLDLDTESPGIVLFTGDNSVGKTTIFNAMGWVLYGKETQEIMGREPSTLPLPSDSLFDENGSCEVKVELHIRDIGSIKKAIITRRAVYKRNFIDPVDHEITLHLRYKDNSDTLLSSKSNRDQVSRFIRQVFPDQMASFHLFDGEFLEYTYTNKGENIVSGIRNMFRIFSIEELKNATKEIEAKYGKDRTKYTSNSKIQEMIEEQNLWEGEKERISKELEKLQGEIKELKDRREELNTQIEKLGNVEAIKEKSDKLNLIEDDIKLIEANIRKSTDKKRKLILKNAYLLNSKDIFDRVSHTLEKLIEKGKLPPEIKDTFVTDLLDRGTCICGTPLTEGGEPRITIEHLLKEIAGSSEREVLLDMYYSVQNSINNIRTIKEQVELENSNFTSYSRQKSEKETERVKIAEALEGYTSYENLVGKYFELKQLRANCETSITEKSTEQGTLGTNYTAAEEMVITIGKEMEKSQERSQKFKLYESYYQKAKNMNLIFSNLIGYIISEIAERYEKKVNEMIKVIPLLSEFTVKISVSEMDMGKMDFEFLQNGSHKFYMAGGQNQLMGILLIAAFTKVMRESRSEDISAPFVVIDNPVSTLSQDNITLFGKILSDLFSGIHLILFTKNTDYGKILIGAGKDISRFYKLFKAQNDPFTTIEEVKLNEN